MKLAALDLKKWISLLSAGFLLAALVGHGQQLLQLSLDAQGWLWLLLGVGLSLLSLVANGLALGVVLQWLGLIPRWQALVLAYLQTNLRKYLPGGIWHLSARVNLLRSVGAPLATPASGGVALLAVLLDPLVAAVTALALVALGGLQGGLGLLCLLPLLLLLPRWLNPLLAWLERRRAPELALENWQGLVDQSPRLPSYPWPLLLAQLGFVLLRFAGFACCVLAFDLQWSLEWTGWLAGFALAWTAGLVVPGAPGGLGVFEAVLLLRLGFAVPEAPILAIAISYRLVVSLADLLAASTARLDAARINGGSSGVDRS
ncbi:lysylphosphatidylglycerol synthase domain-containing protein [Cyanobium sp. WAJ14-Wanaka]|uniref:lysylphosphatidylglycerol synthase domain-containing protein n=1 Tax=Cyanobium sp. WAJ14-Wanaka TaxID=2823725 RepID=UPI0020CDC367|nr:lysylphosphatidylglycerol synthase domain-containing protein [Cyanobium sp. WAJ14-Wanaka]MCP9775014.1 flippase-like domain-containing protein [Cyanobium sp. WAJ14-Wanaka]